MTEKTVWAKAADHLREYGWTKGTVGGDDSGVTDCTCVGGALGLAITDDRGAMYDDFDEKSELVAAMATFANWVGLHPTERRLSWQWVAWWNDRPGRSEAEVFAALAALDELERAGRNAVQ